MSTPDFQDWLAICNVNARYCRLLDTKDWAGWQALFTGDIVLDTSAAGGPRIEGAEAAVAAVRGSIAQAITTHHVHTPEITVDGDEATAIWAMRDRNIWPYGRKLLGFGHYHQRYRRCPDGTWRIAESRLTRINHEMSEG